MTNLKQQIYIPFPTDNYCPVEVKLVNIDYGSLVCEDKTSNGYIVSFSPGLNTALIGCAVVKGSPSLFWTLEQEENYHASV